MHAHGTRDRQRLAALDLLRLAAALAVVAYHYGFRGAAGGGYLSVSYPEVAPLARFGYLGVNLFFVISGFVIAWSAEGRDWRSFALARFARLYPGFVACMTLTFAVTLWLGAGPITASWPQYGANLTMFAPALGQPFMDGAYWSIVLELIFYGWVAVAVFFGVFERWRLEIVAGWLMVSAANELLLGSGALRLIFITQYAPLFCAGILLYQIRSRGPSAEALGLLAAAFALSCAMLPIDQSWMREHLGDAPGLGALLVANVVIFLSAGLASRYGDRLRGGGLVVTLGALTYPLYLLHQHIGYLAIDRLAPMMGRWPALAVTLAIVAVASWAVWRLVERPARGWIMRIGTRLLAWRPAKAQTA